MFCGHQVSPFVGQMPTLHLQSLHAAGLRKLEDLSQDSLWFPGALGVSHVLCPFPHHLLSSRALLKQGRQCFGLCSCWLSKSSARGRGLQEEVHGDSQESWRACAPGDLRCVLVLSPFLFPKC